MILPSHFCLAGQLGRGEAQFQNVGADIPELLIDELSILIGGVERKFESRQRESRGGVHGDETACVVVDVSALVGVGDQTVGRKLTIDFAHGEDCIAQIEEQVLVAKIAAVRSDQSAEGAGRHMSERTGSFLETELGIVCERSELAFEVIAWRSTIGGENNEGSGNTLEQATTGYCFVVRVGNQNQRTPKRFDEHPFSLCHGGRVALPGSRWLSKKIVPSLSSFSAGMEPRASILSDHSAEFDCRTIRLMLQDMVSVTLSGKVGVYQPFHPDHKTLVARLISEGMLKRVFRTSYLDVEVFDPGPDGSLKIIHSCFVQKIVGRPVWAIWRRLPSGIQNRIPPATWVSALLADRLIRSWIPRTQIFHGVMNNCLGQLKRAQQLGAVTIVDVGARHPKLWRQEIIEERRRFGVDEPRGIASGVSIRRMEREFKTCDKITVLSSPARDSFREFAYGHKAEVVLPGIDHTFFTPPAEAAHSPIFRVCYAGRVELAKGLGYLLKAWKRLALSNAELVLIGKVQPDVSAMLKENASANVKLVDFIPPEQLVQYYRNSNVLVFPSVTEGFGLVLLEAMACGIPVVGSDRSGAMDCVTEGQDGFIVPARDVDRLADVILWCYQHRDELALMGRAARLKIESRFTLDHYYERMIALYRAVAAK